MAHNVTVVIAFTKLACTNEWALCLNTLTDVTLNFYVHVG